MSVSVVIPAYNATHFLPQTLDGVRVQTVTNWELLVVDDGSTDGTARVAKDYAAHDGRIHVFSQANAGASAARNTGLARSQGEYIIFLDADDVWEPDALQTLLSALDAHPDCAAAYGLARKVDKDGQFEEPGVLEAHQQERWGVGDDGRLLRWPVERPTTFAVEAVTERVITPGTVLLRRAALEQLAELERGPLFDPALRLWEDWDVWLRLTGRVGSMAFVSRPVLRYRRHENNLSGGTSRLDAGAERVRRKMLASVQDNPKLRHTARLGQRLHHQLVARRRMAWARAAFAEGQPVAALKQVRQAAASYARARR